MLDDEIGADNKVPSAITIGTYMVSAGVKDEAAATFSCLFYDKKNTTDKEIGDLCGQWNTQLGA